MLIVAAPDGVVGRKDRALWLTRPFDLAWSPGDGGGTTPELPTSLLGAIEAYWQSAGLDASIAPLFSEAAPPKQALPFVVIDDVRPDLGGITADDKPIEAYITVWAATSAGATSITRDLIDHLGDSTADVPRPTGRDSFAWTVGDETFAEPQTAALARTKLPYLSYGLIYKQRIHYTFLISGRP